MQRSDDPQNADRDQQLKRRDAQRIIHDAGHSTKHEIFILAAHGILHILGYDHADKDEEKVMFDLQETIVKKWEEKNWTSK